jgi:Domain of unknown function (DUF4398)
MWVGSRLLVLSVGVWVLCSACATPPENEMQQAQTAVDAARSAGADQYAHDEFTAAQDALARARVAVSEHDYRLALNNALDSRERAENAVKLALTQREASRAEAERALTALTTALSTAQARLKAAEGAHVSLRTLAGARRSLANADQRVQEARAAFQKGDYPAATKAASAVLPEVLATSSDLAAAGTASARRRR